MLRLRAMIETFFLIIAILLLMVLLMFGQTIQDVLVEYAPIVAVVTDLILRLRDADPLFCADRLFYGDLQGAANRKATLRSQLVALWLCGGWYVFSFGVSIYIDYFRGFSLYGSLTTIVLIMFWLYFAMLFFWSAGRSITPSR